MTLKLMSLPRTTSSNCTFNPTAYLTSQTQNVQSHAPALPQAPCPQLSCLLPSSYSVLKPWSYPWFHSFFYTHIQFISKTCELKQSVGMYPEADHVSQAKHNHFGPNCCHLSPCPLLSLLNTSELVKMESDHVTAPLKNKSQCSYNGLGGPAWCSLWPLWSHLPLTPPPHTHPLQPTWATTVPVDTLLLQ